MRFDKSDRQPAQQGDLDGFCGVYTGVNYFCRFEGLKTTDDEAPKIFRQIVKALHDQGDLTVHRICEGFLEGKLQKAFNKVARKRGLPVKVERLSVFVKRSKASTIFDAVANLREGEAAMLSMNRGCHWVLAFDCDGETMKVDDSSEEPRTCTWRREDSRSLGLSKLNGLVFLDAQTH